MSLVILSAHTIAQTFSRWCRQTRDQELANSGITVRSSLHVNSLSMISHSFDVVYGGCVVFKSMIEIGFLNLLQGSASLTQMLSCSAWHMKSSSTAEHDEHDESSIDYARYSLMATRALRRRLDDPIQRASLETITAILAFAAFAVCAY